MANAAVILVESEGHLAPIPPCCLWKLAYLNSTSSTDLLDSGR